jgi:putative ATP-binding cassette transporter
MLRGLGDFILKKKKIKISLLLLVLATTLFSTTVFSEGGNTESKDKKIEELINGVMQKSKIPGVSIAIIDENNKKYQSYGYSDLKKKTDVSEKTLFQIGSLSKSYTALAILSLEEEGKLSLNDNVSKYIPWFKVQYDSKNVELKISDLLYQRSGFTNNEGGYELPDIDTSLKDTIKNLSGSELSFYPGTKYTYSNINYNILGLIVESASGESYEDFMKHNVLLPHGLRDTYVNPDKAYSSKNMSTGYKLSFLKAKQLDNEIITGKIPAGYIISDIRDLSSWLMLHMRSDETKNNIQKSHVPDLSVTSVEGNHYAAGWFIKDNENTIYHEGGTSNYSSIMIIDSETKRAVCVLANMNSASDVQYIGENVLNILNDKETTLHKHDIIYIFDMIFMIITAISFVLILLFIARRVGLVKQIKRKNILH